MGYLEQPNNLIDDVVFLLVLHHAFKPCTAQTPQEYRIASQAVISG